MKPWIAASGLPKIPHILDFGSGTRQEALFLDRLSDGGIVAMWESLSTDTQQRLHAIGRRQHLLDDTYIFHQGDVSTNVFLILDGRVKLTTIAPSGLEVLIELRGPGQMLGEVGVVDGGPRSATAQASGPVEVLSISSDQFNLLLSEEPALSIEVLRCVVRRLRQSVIRRLNAGTSDVRQQLCGRLAELVESHPAAADGSIEVDPPLTQQELANWIGVSRDAIVIALRSLRDEGLVETGRMRIRILDVDALIRIAGEG